MKKAIFLALLSTTAVSVSQAKDEYPCPYMPSKIVCNDDKGKEVTIAFSDCTTIKGNAEFKSGGIVVNPKKIGVEIDRKKSDSNAEIWEIPTWFGSPDFQLVVRKNNGPQPWIGSSLEYKNPNDKKASKQIYNNLTCRAE